MAFNKKRSRALSKKKIPLASFFKNLDEAIKSECRYVEQQQSQYLENGRYSENHHDEFWKMMCGYTDELQTNGVDPSHGVPFIKALTERFAPPGVCVEIGVI